MNTQNNLGIYRDRWFKTYKGRVYKNSATDIQTAINNKVIIDTMKPIEAILNISKTTNP
jgi:hypothetical protein